MQGISIAHETYKSFDQIEVQEDLSKYNKILSSRLSSRKFNLGSI